MNRVWAKLSLRSEGRNMLLQGLLLILSIAPVIFIAAPMAIGEYESFSARYLDRDPFEPPAVELPGGLAARAAASPASPGRVPVLLYHGIGDSEDAEAPGESRFSVSRAEFARQMELLDEAGFEALTIEEYGDFLAGDREGLPDKPVLITFDDGQLSSFRGADSVLATHDMHAVMYAIASATTDASEYYLSGDELAEMAESGRWDVQMHAGVGHHAISTGPGSQQGSFYAYREWTDDGRESFADYKQRVGDDLTSGAEELAWKAGNFEPVTFSFPFGDYGQGPGGEPRVSRWLVSWLADRYQGLFHQPSDPGFSEPAQAPLLPRFEVTAGTSTGELASWIGGEG